MNIVFALAFINYISCCNAHNTQGSNYFISNTETLCTGFYSKIKKGISDFFSSYEFIMSQDRLDCAFVMLSVVGGSASQLLRTDPEPSSEP